MQLIPSAILAAGRFLVGNGFARGRDNLATANTRLATALVAARRSFFPLNATVEYFLR
jgi:hypothetical protein